MRRGDGWLMNGLDYDRSASTILLASVGHHVLLTAVLSDEKSVDQGLDGGDWYT